ncbi:EXO1 [Candida jiufengensis]|uniref:EXO1 n=1 Tax=Candida jiufengensis TaxID=497108 RepID=UPI002224ECBE|nr:EXO1 [Candida jiufengensis]KAI5956528.1 EXO1 [Candida jiufengensis]
MGVNGLLQLLREIQDPGSLERYRGKTLAIDTYGWLHRALISCAEELCLGKPTRKYITFVMNKIQMLQHFGITPYFVFDGASLKTKSETNQKRRDIRNEAKELAKKFNESGRSHLAVKQYMKAAYVTSQMCKSIMCELDILKIKYVVAPYEADPQMVYLEKIGLVDGILSEDSDLLIFGCQKLITKLKDDSSCVEINRSDFGKVKQIPYLNCYSDEQLRLVAMISGCDYTRGVNGVGLKSSFQIVRRYVTLQKVLIALRSTGKKIPDGFEDEVEKANLAFQFQKVFDPRNQVLATLNDIPDTLEIDEVVLESCCGRTIEAEVCQKICNGKIDPNSHQLLVSREQNIHVLKSASIQLSSRTSNKYNQTTTIDTAQRSKSESSIKNNNNRSIFDLLKISRKTVKTSEEIEEETTTNVTVSRTLKTPEKLPFKRPNIVLGTRELKISPTTKKIKKLQNITNSTTASKFFGLNKVRSPPSDKKPAITKETTHPIKNTATTKVTHTVLPTPNKTVNEFPDWDSSLINDSEVPDESPTSQSVNVENILGELTDNDLEDSKSQEQESKEEIENKNDSKESQEEQIMDSQFIDSPTKPTKKLTNLNLKFSQVSDCEISEEESDLFKVNTKIIDLQQFAFKG